MHCQVDCSRHFYSSAPGSFLLERKKNETADIEMHTIKSSCNWIFYLRFGANGNGYFRGAHSSSACVFQFSQRILNAFSSPIPGLFNSKCFHSRASVTIHGSWIPDDMRPALVDPIQLFKTGWTRIRHNQSVRFQRFRPKNFFLPLFSFANIKSSLLREVINFQIFERT
jgi:hypothetical protein